MRNTVGLFHKVSRKHLAIIFIVVSSFFYFYAYNVFAETDAQTTETAASGSTDQTTTTTTSTTQPITTTVPITTITTQTIPAAPSALTYTVSGNAVTLRWTDNANNENKFNIERKLSSAMVYMFLNQLMGSDITHYVDYGVYPGVSYDYRVQACLSGTGCSDYATLSGVNVQTTSTAASPSTATTYPSSSETTTTSTSGTSGTTTTGSGSSSGGTETTTSTWYIPAMPTFLGLAAAPTATSISLKWNDNSTTEDKFNIDRRLSNSDKFTHLIQLVGANITTYVDNTVTGGKTYDYRVQACRSGSGCSEYAYLKKVSTPVSTSGTYVQSGAQTIQPATETDSTKTLTTYTASSPYSAPSAPTGIQPYSGCYAITLNWPPVTGATYYRILRNSNSLNSTTLPNFTDAGLSMGTKYVYSVHAANSYGTSPGTTIEVLTSSSCSGPAPLPGTASYYPSLYPTTTYSLSAYPTTTYATVTNPLKTVQIATSLSPYAKTILYPASSTTYIKPEFYSTYKYSSTTVLLPAPIYIKPATSTVGPEIRQIGNAPLRIATTSSSTKNIERENPKYIAQANNILAIGDAFESSKKAVEKTKDEIAKIVDKTIEKAVKENEKLGIATSSEKIKEAREELLNTIDMTLNEYSATTSVDFKPEKVVADLKDGLGEILAIVSTTSSSTPHVVNEIRAAATVLESLSETIQDGNKALHTAGGDKLFKDTNNDGISDYDSVHVYDIDPVKPSPVTISGGKSITAGEKVLLGYDPKQAELVKVSVEEPKSVQAPVLTSLKVEEVKLSEEKKVVVKGKALPNSYVTVYIYSTPIIVTVKANHEGEWQYVMDKELESGEHTIYTATVNNSGKILVKSSEYSFTKTAEAATLNVVPPVVVAQVPEPQLFSAMNIYIPITVGIIIILATLYFVGVRSRRSSDIDPGLPNVPGV